LTRVPEQLAIGDVVASRFRLEELIGEGGMGRVWRANQLNLGRQIALKVLIPGALDRIGVDRFVREAKVAASLRHPGVVEIYDTGEDEGLVYIAMQLLHGDSLRGRMVEGVPEELSAATDIAAQIADVLVAAHAISLVHRDLKPENVFIEDPLRVRIVDFGLAFIEGGSDLGRITRDGLVVGTPAYLAPEQAQGLHVGTAADVYSFGCVLYELVTGLPPFRGSQMNVLTQHLYVAPVSVRERAPTAGIPPDLDDLVMQMMSKRPEDRPTASALRDRLASIRRTFTGERNRGRDQLPLQGRAARMVSVVPNRMSTIDDADPAAAMGPVVLEAPGIRLAIYGDLTREETLGLASNGIEPIPLLDDVDPRSVLADAALSIGNSPARLQALTATGVPVIATALGDDVEQLSALLRLGVREVLILPMRIDDLARKVRRIFERSGRGLP
jgi:serine/threonine-protein kinase